MFDKNYSLAVEIKNLILSNFCHVDINIVYDRELDEYFISTHDEKLYYSESYGMLILKINQDILWKQGIFNFFFILDMREHEFGKMTKTITFSPTDEINYKTWDVSKTSLFFSNFIDMGNTFLAA